VKTASGAVAVQIVYAIRRGSREIEHIGSARSPGEVEVLKTVARQRLHAYQDTLDFDDGQLGEQEAPILASQARHLWETLSTAYRALGLDRACADEVFAQLVLARVIEPTSKLDAIRVLTELGIPAPSYPTIKRRLPVYATSQWRQQLAGACADHVGLARRRWCFMTAPPCTSRSMRETGSGSPGSPKSGGWSRRSPSGC
jgi:hypothetical protein